MHSNIVITFVLVLLIIFINEKVQSHDILKEIQNTTRSSEDYIEDSSVESARRKKKSGKYLIPILLATLMIKSIIFPLAFKAMAVMSSIAVLLSTMSLIVSSIVGYIKLAVKSAPTSIKVVHKPPFYHWAKEDGDSLQNYYTLDQADYDPNAVVSKDQHLKGYFP